jgi:hypothetical protein
LTREQPAPLIVRLGWFLILWLAGVVAVGVVVLLMHGVYSWAISR